MANAGEYILREDLKVYLAIGTDETDDDELLWSICQVASRAWDRWCGRWFYPLSATRYYDHPERDASTLKLDADLLEVTTLTPDNTDTTIDSGPHLLPAGLG